MRTKESEIRTAWLGSGTMTTIESLLEANKADRFKNVKPALLVADRTGSRVEELAGRFDIPWLLIPVKDFKKDDELDFDAWSAEVAKKFADRGIEFFGMHGLLSLLKVGIPGLNQHNGPTDPERGHDYGGRMMYGPRVVASRLAFSYIYDDDFWTESVVHNVEPEYDTGTHITTARFDYDRPTLPGPITIHTLFQDPKGIQYLKDQTELVWKGEDKVGGGALLGLEHQNVIRAYDILDEVGIDGLPRKVRPEPLTLPEAQPLLAQIKPRAINLYAKKKVA